MANLAEVRTGDALIIRVRVREIGLDGALWCDNPFHKTSGRYAAIVPHPEVIAVEKAEPRGSAEGVAAQVEREGSREEPNPDLPTPQEP